MAAPEAPSRGVAGGDGPDTMLKLVCSHGGRLLPHGPDGAVRYAGGETRVLAVPRAASFRDLPSKLQEMVPSGAEVRAVRHRLADEDLEDVLVSVTCDNELAHMRHEYDRLRATRPAARFRLFVTTAAAQPPAAGSGSGGGVHRGRSPAAAGLPPLAPKMYPDSKQRATDIDRGRGLGDSKRGHKARREAPRRRRRNQISPPSCGTRSGVPLSSKHRLRHLAGAGGWREIAAATPSGCARLGRKHTARGWDFERRPGTEGALAAPVA
ncbi:unnamed protein product [Urochloa humidicola]